MFIICEIVWKENLFVIGENVRNDGWIGIVEMMNNIGLVWNCWNLWEMMSVLELVRIWEMIDGLKLVIMWEMMDGLEFGENCE